MDAPQAAVARQFEVAKWLATELNGLPVVASLRNRVSGGCLTVTQDHHCAIALLLEKELFASAFALVRIQFESYVRGLWLAHVATDGQVAQFSTGTEPPPMNALLASLENVESFQDGHLSHIKQESWSAMCSYTHTGGLQVQRWQTAEAIEQNYLPEEIVGVATFSGSIALLAGIGMATLANDDALGQRMLSKSRAYANNAF